MTRRPSWIVAAAALVLASLGAGPAQSPKPSTPSDDEIGKILTERVDTLHQSVGIVAGIITPSGRRIVAHGAVNAGDARPLNGDTIFEIGSLSKVFTSLLLADMATRGEVSLTDPIGKFLPAGTKLPSRNGRQITLVDLATHTSGLPRLPANFQPRDDGNPYADYTAPRLYAFLAAFELPRDIGSQFEYSNLGGGLLGHVLALRAGMDYGELVRARITGPLGMSSTFVMTPKSLDDRMAVGHDADLKVVPYWEAGASALQGAYVIRSSANDMLTFLAANLGLIDTKLASAMAAMRRPLRPAGSASLSIGLGWLVRTETPVIVWHNGGTGGFRSWAGFDPASRVGAVVLSNTETTTGVDDIGGHIVDPTIDVLTAKDLAPKTHTAIAVNPKLFDGYVGRFQMAPNFILTVSRDGAHLFAQATGQGKFEIFPEADKEFFAKIADIQFTFQTGPDGIATGVVVHQGGIDTPAKRVQ